MEQKPYRNLDPLGLVDPALVEEYKKTVAAAGTEIFEFKKTRAYGRDVLVVRIMTSGGKIKTDVPIDAPEFTERVKSASSRIIASHKRDGAANTSRGDNVLPYFANIDPGTTRRRT